MENSSGKDRRQDKLIYTGPFDVNQLSAIEVATMIIDVDHIHRPGLFKHTKSLFVLRCAEREEHKLIEAEWRIYASVN